MLSSEDESIGMVMMALRTAEAEVLQKYAASDRQRPPPDRQKSDSNTDMTHLVAARQADSDETRQLVCKAIDSAHDRYVQQHRCTYERHSHADTPQLSHTGGIGKSAV